MSADLARAVDLWSTARIARGDVGRATGRNERWTLLGFADHLGDRPVESIDRETIEAWIAGKELLKRETRREHLRILRGFLDDLVAGGVLTRNPASGVTVPKPPGMPPLRRFGPVPHSVDDVVGEYLAHLERCGRRDATIYQRRRQLARFDAWLGDTTLLDATLTELRAYIDRMHDYTIESRHGEISGLRTFYRWATTEELVGRDPAARLVLPRRPSGIPRPMPDVDVERVLALATDPPMRQWLHLAAFAGLRAGEISRVCRDDVVSSRGGPVLIVPEGKGGRPRVVPIGDELYDVLGEAGIPRSGHLFPKRTDPRRPVSGPQVSKRANRWLHDLGVSHTLHSLRHFYGTTLYDRTHNLRLVQERLGHSNPATTALYTWLSPDEGADEVRDLPRWWRERNAEKENAS